MRAVVAVVGGSSVSVLLITVFATAAVLGIGLAAYLYRSDGPVLAVDDDVVRDGEDE